MLFLSKLRADVHPSPPQHTHTRQTKKDEYVRAKKQEIPQSQEFKKISKLLVKKNPRWVVSSESSQSWLK